MKILIDMNLSPVWVETFVAANIEAVHWSSIGSASSKDTEIAEYARVHGFVIFTHDLDFGTILALTHSAGPSVLQVRTQDIMPSGLGVVVIGALKENQQALEKGALIVVDETRLRVRILPLT